MTTATAAAALDSLLDEWETAGLLDEWERAFAGFALWTFDQQSRDPYNRLNQLLNLLEDWEAVGLLSPLEWASLTESACDNFNYVNRPLLS